MIELNTYTLGFGGKICYDWIEYIYFGIGLNVYFKIGFHIYILRF